MPDVGTNEHRGGVDPEILGDLDDFVDAVASLTPGDCARLVAFWEAGDESGRLAAHEHARSALEQTGRRELVRSVQGGLIQWSGGAPRGGTGWGDRSFDPPGDPMLEGGRRSAALPALADTALALAVQDVLPERDFDVLFGPWSHAMGVGNIELDGGENASDTDQAGSNTD